MRLARIVLIMIFLVALGSAVNGETSDKQGALAKNTVAINKPQEVVRYYFTAYIAWLQYDLKKEGNTLKLVPNLSLDPSYVTQHYIESYKKLMQTN